MEADSTETRNSHVSQSFSAEVIIDEQSPKVQSSQISSCEEDTVVASSSTLIFENESDSKTEYHVEDGISTDSTFNDPQLTLKDLHVGSTETDISTALSEKELESIEESVLKKYTGLDMDLASENQLLKEDVIKCRCELEKYGRKLTILEGKLDKANSYNDDLRVQIDKLSREVHEYRREKHKIFVHVDTQTSSEDIMDIEDDTLYDVNLPGNKPECDMTLDWKVDSDGQTGEGDSEAQSSLQTPGLTIAESLKATAEAAMNQTGYVYDEQSGLYYDYNTGYYYNAEKGLYYDPKSGTYFYYNKTTGKYEFHSQVDLSYYAPKHGHSDRSHNRHSHSEKHPTRSPEHGESSSGKKKKKKESRRRSSEEKEPKKKKRKKDKSRDNSDESDEERKSRKKRDKSRNNSDESDEEKNKKKRKTSTENTDSENKGFNNIIYDMNKKFIDQSNFVIGEVNYKKMKQGDKLSQDALRKPKLLTENQANVSICDDVIKDEGKKVGTGLGLGGKKIKLVLKKKEKEEEELNEKGGQENSDKVTFEKTQAHVEKVKDDSEKEQKKESEYRNQMMDNLSDKSLVNDPSTCSEASTNSSNEMGKKMYKNDMKSTSSEIDTNLTAHEEKKASSSETPNQNTDLEICESTTTGKQKEVESVESDLQENQGESAYKQGESEVSQDPTQNPFYISGLEIGEGSISFDNVGIVNNEEILSICSKVNSEKSPEEPSDKLAENKDTNSVKDRSVNCEENTEKGEYMGKPLTTTNTTDSLQGELSSIDNITNEMLGVGENENRQLVFQGENIIKIVKQKSGEEDFYSDEDDIMIVEKTEEKVMIELDSDDSNDGTEISTENLIGKQCDIEPGELTESSSSDFSSSSDSQESGPQSNWVEIIRKPTQASEESTLKNAPCIRAMVTLSDFLEEGTLFIVTIEGGMVGREKRPDLVIMIPDINVSKVHAEIRYNKKQQEYTIQDKGSQNGTYVNEVRLSESKQVSKWMPIKHEDTLQISCTRFELHVHPGTDTCDKCEPGQVAAFKQTAEKQPVVDTRDKKTQHKEKLKSIKKKYGLQGSSYSDNTAAINNPAYQDKAEERRKTVGSDNPHKQDAPPSSTLRPIAEENKGHRLLKKMGWSEGESLGKDNTGIQEPINITVRVDQSAGLGALGKANELSIGNIGIIGARRKFMQTQIRYTHSGTTTKDSQYQPKIWVQGDTQDNNNLVDGVDNKSQ